MTRAARERLRVRAPLLLISGGAWALLVADPSALAMPMYCSAGMLAAMRPFGSIALLMTLNPPGSLAAGWALMLAAMMVPLLIAPVRHIRDRSFAQRRIRGILLFVAVYAAIWMAAGIVLLEVALATRFVAEPSLVLAVATMVAFIWQFSPLKQRCLNRCHAQPGLAARGLAADIDVLRFGLTHGIWCVGSCWAMMVLPMLVSGWHVAAMAAVALWIFAERLETPMQPRWRVRGPGKAMRIAIAQAWMPLTLRRQG